MKKIAYLGIPGSNSYTAARLCYDEDNQLIGCTKFDEIYRKVLGREVDLGMIPIENSLTGSIVENYDLLSLYNVFIIKEYFLKVDNHLLAIPEGIPEQQMATITKVYSHPQPLVQCSQFFQSHPNMQPVGFTDTATAAKYVSEQKDPTIAAIANGDAAEQYGLTILQRNIADDNDNITRFFVISGSQNIETNVGKCSLIFSLPHIPGSLVHALEVFSSHDLNLLKIESRPIKGKRFEYLFYVDVAFSKPLTEVHAILEQFKTKTQTLKILGFYSAGV